MFTREEYESLINNSPLFEIDKESSPALYKSERYNFLTLLTEYYSRYAYQKKELEEYSLTLMETAIECIKYYDRSKGEFLHLFNSLMKRDLRIAKAKEMLEERRQGIKVSSETDNLIRKIVAFADSKNLDVYDISVQEKIAKGFGIELNKLQELLRVNYDAVAMSSTVMTEDNEEIELFDLQASHGKTQEDNFIEEETFISLLDRIDSVFVTVQERQKRLLSMLLTVEVVKACNEDLDKARQVLSGKKLFNKEIITYYETKGELPTAKQIGEQCGVSEQSLSRTYKNFKEKLSKEKQ